MKMHRIQHIRLVFTCLLVTGCILFLSCEDDGSDPTQSADAEANVAGAPSTIRHKQLDLTVGPIGIPCEIDVNDDNKTDVVIKGYINITMDVPTSAGEAFFVIRGGPFILDPFSAKMTIDGNPPESYTWISPRYGATLASQRYQYLPEPETGPWLGPWAYVSKGYLPIQLTVTGLVHYGWISMSFPDTEGVGHGTVKIHDCAYETVAGKGIIAGATQ